MPTKPPTPPKPPRRSKQRRPQPAKLPVPLLEDRIAPGVRVLFVGINPGIRSALTGHHFAGFSNRFWKLLYESGLAPEPVTYLDDDRMPEWGLGTTNLVARPTRGVNDLAPGEYAAGRAALERKIRRYKPRIVALTGVSLARALLPPSPASASPSAPASVSASAPVPASASASASTSAPASASPSASASAWAPSSASASAPMPLGLHSATLAGVPVFVLPNPSGRNAHFSYARMLDAFTALKRYASRR
jgi:double-stranded uracil-DNA glycosylase